MLNQKKKRYVFSAVLFIFLCTATIIGFILLKKNQDNRQQASTACPGGEPYCDNLPSVITPSIGSDLLKNKGIISTTYTGERPNTEAGCGSVWMNNFCYMPGDEFAGGLKVVDSGRYGYAYIENKQVAESLAFGAENVSEKIGTTENLGEACGGKGFAIDKTCYAYGAAVNGYLVMPARTSNCNNATGDYCYAHLKKIEVPYQDWQAAVSTYEQTGETKVLEELYKKTYGISFEASALYDPTVANANLLKAQAILSALTNASVLQQKAAAQNAALSSKGNLSSDEQALFDFNLQIINDKNLDKRYQILDQISDSTSQQTTINTAVKKMYSDLVVTGSDNDLNKIANQKFKEIFGYDPSEKYGNVNGILTAFGIDPDQLNRDRDEYAKKIAEAVEKQKQSIENQDQPVKNQAQQISYQDQMVDKKAEASLTDAEKNAPLDLASLYKFYTGNTPNFQMLENESYLQKEVARYDAQAALSFFAKTQDVTYLNQYYLNNFKPSQSQMTSILSDPKNLLMAIYGEQGRDIYRSIVIPNKFNSAVDNFVNDGGKSLISVCKELNMTNCQNIGPDNATSTVSIMLDQMYKDRPEVNVAELAVQYANKIATDGKVVLAQKEQQLSNLSRAYQYAVIDQKVLTKAQQDYQTALAASKVFNSFDTFNFATEGENRQSLSDRTWGLTYGNALMQDNISNRAFSTESMKLNSLQTIDLTFNQLISQIAGVDVAQNIATNYESQKYYNYAGPADTTIANVALMGANNLGKLDYKYQAAQKGYYFNKDMRSTGEWIGNLAVQAGAYSAAAQMNDTLLKQSMYTDKQFSYIDPVDYAKKASDEFLTTYKKETADQLYKNYISNVKNTVDNVDKLSFEKFLEDPEIRRSSQELNYEVLEKVVAPSVAIVALPVLIAGAAPALALGVASTGFSLYQGSGMKAQALEIQRIDIQSRENAIVKSYIENGASPQEINDLRADLDLQVETLNKQGNLMLANSAVAAFTSAGGLLTTAAGAASTANAAVNVIATSGQVLTKAGQVGGIAMNSYNAVNSGISSYNAFNEGNYAQAGMSALSSFVAASGVAGNTFGLVGPTTNTNKIDYVLDAMNVPAGAAVDAQQVAQACFGSSGAFSEKDCTNAWIGLALSAGQNVAQISSSYKAYKTDGAAAKLTDFQKQIDAIDAEILALSGPNKGMREGLQIVDLKAQRSTLITQVEGISSNFRTANAAGSTENYMASSARVASELETQLKTTVEAGQAAEAKYLAGAEAARVADIQQRIEAIDSEVLDLSTRPNTGISEGLKINDLAGQKAALISEAENIARAETARRAAQAESEAYLAGQIAIFKEGPKAIAVVRDQINAIDEQITKRGILMPESEVADLQQKRAGLVADLETLTKGFSAVDSLKTQNETLLQVAQKNEAFSEYQALLKNDTQKASLVKQYAPDTEQVTKYQTDLEANATGVRLETDPSRRLLSIANLQDNLAKISELETQKQKLMVGSGDDDSSRKIDELNAEIEGIRQSTDAVSADSRSVSQKITDFFSPGKSTRKAYYKSLDLTREAETIRAKLAGVGADSDDAKVFREQLADVNRQLRDQQYLLAQAAANPSKGIRQTVTDFVSSFKTRGQIADLKNAAKKMGTGTLKIAEEIAAKQAQIEKLKTENATTNQAEITRLEGEVTELLKTARNPLKGASALIAVDKSGEFTRYVVTEAGATAGIKQKQLDILNTELQAFETFRRSSETEADVKKNGGPFKIYSGTDTFKDQDVFLLAEVEAFGAGRRGTVFGALPGMGKTDVVMPFNILLKQRLTGEAQFVVFPEAKLAKPWTTGGENPIPNKAFIDYVESQFGKGSVVIVKANDTDIDPIAIANAKFVITTKDVAFDLQNTDTKLGLNLRSKWRNSFVHADEVDWTFNPNENYKLSGTQVALRDRAEFGLYADAQKQVLGIDENGNSLPGRGLSTLNALVNELSMGKSIPEGITRTSDGKGGKFANPELEKQVLGEWLGTWGGQSKIPGLDMSADVQTIRQQINDYLTRGTDTDIHQRRAEMAMINETVNFLSRVPGEDYGPTSNKKLIEGVEEVVSSIAPREQGRTSGRSYSAVAESLLYNSLGARVMGANGQVDINKITVGEGGSEINYALLMLESRGFSLYTGTPETVAKLYKMAYGIELNVFTDSAVDSSIARFNAPPAGTNSRVFTNLQDQMTARLADGRNQVFINMASGLRSNEAALNNLVKTITDTGAPYQKVLLVGANGELVEYQISGRTLIETGKFASTEAMNERTTALDQASERYIKFYEYGAHVGVDTANNVSLSRAIGLCNGCDQTTFSQGINRVRVQVSKNADGTYEVKHAPIDIVWLDAPNGKTSLSIDDFASAIKDRQTVNEALAEVSFKETLLKNSVDGTIVELIDLARNGKKGFLGFGSYKKNLKLVAQLEAAQQKWKETMGMNYMLGSDDMTAQAKLEKTASQVSAAYDELTRLLAGSGEPAKLLAKRADGAVGDNPVKLAFSGDEGYQVLGENPSYRQIVDLINQSSKHLESVAIAFTNKSSATEVVGNEMARAANEAQTNSSTGPDGNIDGGVAPVKPGDNSPDAGGDNGAGPVRPVGGGVNTGGSTTNNETNNRANNTGNNTTRNLGFATFVSNLWNGTVDEKKLLAENAAVVETNITAIIADYQAQIEKLNEQLDATTEQTEKDAIDEQIKNLEAAKVDQPAIDAAANAKTTEQLADNYRTGGIKSFLGNAERGGSFTISAAPLANFLLGWSDSFNEQAFIADNQAEIENTALQMKDEALAEKTAAMQVAVAEMEKISQELQKIVDIKKQQELLASMEALAKQGDEIKAEHDAINQKDFTAEATSIVREKYAKDAKYVQIGLATRLSNLRSGAGRLLASIPERVRGLNVSADQAVKVWSKTKGFFADQMAKIPKSQTEPVANVIKNEPAKEAKGEKIDASLTARARKIGAPSSLISSWTTNDQINIWLNEQKDKFDRLNNVFLSFNLSSPKISTLSEYQKQLDNLSKILSNIDDLQRRSGLTFIAVSGNTDDIRNLSIVFQNQTKFRNLSDFENQAKQKIKASNFIIAKVNSFLSSFSKPGLTGSLTLRQLNKYLAEAASLVDGLERLGVSNGTIFSKLKSLANDFANKQNRINSLVAELKESNKKHNSLSGKNSQLANYSDLSEEMINAEINRINSEILSMEKAKSEELARNNNKKIVEKLNADNLTELQRKIDNFEDVGGAFGELLWTHNTPFAGVEGIFQSGGISSLTTKGRDYIKKRGITEEQFWKEFSGQEVPISYVNRGFNARYGLSSDYGDIKFVFKPGFENGRTGYTRDNSWFGQTTIGPAILDFFNLNNSLFDKKYRSTRDSKVVNMSGILGAVSRIYTFNKYLSSEIYDENDLPGQGALERPYSNPQLQIAGVVSLNDVQAILVPEHLYDEVVRLARKNGFDVNKIVKVKTGKASNYYAYDRSMYSSSKSPEAQAAIRQATLNGLTRPDGIGGIFGSSVDMVTAKDAFEMEQQAYLQIMLNIEKEKNAQKTASGDNFLFNLMVQKLGKIKVNINRRSYDLSYFFNSDAGLWEKYSVLETTEMAYRQFNKYFSKNLSAEENNFFVMLIMFHDIGMNIEKTQNLAPHSTTVEIARQVLAKLGYSQSEIQNFVAYIDQDFLGNFLTDSKNVSLEETFSQIKAQADKYGIGLTEYMRKLYIFYMSDVSSYTKDAGGFASLERVLDESELSKGRLNLNLANQQKLKQLEDMANAFVKSTSNSSNPKFKFNSLCSDCALVREQTKAGVELADSLLAEADAFNKQAAEARNANDQTKATDLTKQADAKKQAALKQLNDTRFQVVNSHGMQNQCVQLYLNAWVNTREALIRKTRADVDNAIDSVYDATVLAEAMLDSKKMSVKQGGFFGFGAKEEIKDLSDLELGQVNDLLLGNDALGIEGLNSFALFAKNNEEITRVIIGGSLMKMDNSVISNNPINPVRVYFRNFYRDAKNTILFGKNEKIVIQFPNLKFILPKINIKFDPSKINISKLRTVGGVVGDVTIKGWKYTSNIAQRFYGSSEEFIKGIEVGKSTTKIIGAANIWFKSILPKSNTTPVNTPVAINVSVTPVVSITVTPSITNSPSPTFTPSPIPATENDKDGEDFLRKLINGLSKTNFMGALWKFGIFMAADLLTKGEELGILTLELNEYKNALPPYDPSSEKSQKLAAMGIYEDYVCHNGDAYSKDLTKKSDNLSQMGDCKSGCYKGACLAKIGDSCDGGKIVFAAKTNKCLLSCKSGKLVESNSCGHADVEAYSNKAYWEVYQSLGTIPEETLNDTKVYMYATWNNSLNGGSAIAFAMSAGINIRPAVIGGGYANSPEVVVHEYFHLWGGQEYRWYPDWAPFAMLFAIPERIIYALFHTTDVSVPRDYVDLLGYKVETYKEYNSKDNIFYYSNHNYPITGYGGLTSEKIQISEDFADSAAWYVNKSCELKSKSQIRYDYFKNNVFGGIEYLPDGGCDN